MAFAPRTEDRLRILPWSQPGNRLLGLTLLAIAYEIKRSRGDFLRDVKKANTKHRGAKAYSDEFYYVAPPNMIKVEELPPWAGLIEVKSHAEGLLTVKKVHIPDPNLNGA